MVLKKIFSLSTIIAVSFSSVMASEVDFSSMNIIKCDISRIAKTVNKVEQSDIVLYLYLDDKNKKVYFDKVETPYVVVYNDKQIGIGAKGRNENNSNIDMAIEIDRVTGEYFGILKSIPENKKDLKYGSTSISKGFCQPVPNTPKF